MQKLFYFICGLVVIIISWILYEVFYYEEHLIEGDFHLVHIYVTGEVVMPGEYIVSSNTTYGRLIEYAQGYTKNADLSDISLDSVIKGNYLNVNRIEDNSPDEENKINTNRVNLNNVSYDELIKLDGITHNRATEIINFRKTNLFLSVEDLLLVKGIGEVTFDKIKDYFYI